MSWQIFIIVTFISAFLVYPGFELFQRISIKKREIPAYGVKIWQRRHFLFWNDYKRAYGDLVFLSFLNGFVSLSFSQIKLIEYYLFASWFFASLLFATLWLIKTRKDFTVGKLARWDWHFVAPNAKITTAGKYHLTYLFFEANVIQLALFLLFQPIEQFIKVGILMSLCGYVLTVLYDAIADRRIAKAVLSSRQK